MSPKTAPRLEDFALFAEACAALTLASLAVRFWPFRWIVASTRIGAGRQTALDPAPIALAVRRASRRLPWRIVCFQEGLATHWMLRGRGGAAQLHYGVRSDADRLSAHVWVSLWGQPVIGEEQADPHRCVATFPTPPLDA
ncbi:MAG: hypothetical protein AVDCRST_MAG09-2190 [uncultured Sphingomonas sp.]|uniref:Microcin J25-processing protein McjB C-terminal domain-containing protein n=1 Tax=uncultured Sphingomonas sp. TaxID=158754 RepID=A0A6J4TFM6_9SPHN|nr:lasso peptide biosynthesis B2 protein [uncultured Sphingomonas sp.]CAA9521907.1 MAG: hypothetical protein AVDCRST_MAG09-2190 [uncultured Sphingomonas sp.]